MTQINTIQFKNWNCTVKEKIVNRGVGRLRNTAPRINKSGGPSAAPSTSPYLLCGLR
jgi:hypothetical protein